MSAVPTAAASFALAAGTALLATPVAIRIARKTHFLDHPRGYHQHAAPTPLLGGATVLAAFLLTSLTVAGATGRLLVPLGCALGLCVLGTIDDRIAVRPAWRLLAEAAAASALYAAGLGWATSFPGAVDYLLTVASVLIAVNAFNLMDNLDGACGAVTATAAAGAGVVAILRGNAAVAGAAFALAGSCAGFLPFNLAGPAKIFLGDGGSMPAGFLVAALVMATAWRGSTGDPALIVGALLAGLPIFDAALVSYSRTRRGVRIMTGGRDHLTHRLLRYVQSPRAVAAAVAALQALLCSLAILGYKLGPEGVAWLGLGAFLAGALAIIALDTPRWRPAGIAAAERRILREHLSAGAAQVEDV
jgi:UDP-GlcNAc:undecaprenyl-phosphate GlcNAc-1-phosphate transferase